MGKRDRVRTESTQSKQPSNTKVVIVAEVLPWRVGLAAHIRRQSHWEDGPAEWP